jgi:hypothetical protein
VLRYAHEHGCPWDWVTCYRAAKRGQLEVLRYAREHGCPMPVSVLEECRADALARGHAEMVGYLLATQPDEEDEEDEEPLSSSDEEEGEEEENDDA